MVKIVIAFLLISSASLCYSQTWKYVRNEFSIGVGSSNFFGELGGAKGDAKHDFRDLRLSTSRPVLSLGYKYMLNPIVSFKASFNTAYLSGDDASTKNEVRKNRNLSFRTGIWELALGFEVYPFSETVTKRYKIRGVGGKKSFSLSPYMSFGVGFAYFQPKAKLDGTWHKLQPLGTEGQGLAGRPDKYDRYTMTIPLGVGLKYTIDENWSIGFELSVRFTLTDYLDDVSTSYYLKDEIIAANGEVAAALADRALDPSKNETGVVVYGNGVNNYLQRGDPSYNDSYSLAIFSLHYRFRKGTRYIPKF